jgi:hypothetical protein
LRHASPDLVNLRLTPVAGKRNDCASYLAIREVRELEALALAIPSRRADEEVDLAPYGLCSVLDWHRAKDSIDPSLATLFSSRVVCDWALSVEDDEDACGGSRQVEIAWLQLAFDHAWRHKAHQSSEVGAHAPGVVDRDYVLARIHENVLQGPGYEKQLSVSFDDQDESWMR